MARKRFEVVQRHGPLISSTQQSRNPQHQTSNYWFTVPVGCSEYPSPSCIPLCCKGNTGTYRRGTEAQWLASDLVLPLLQAGPNLDVSATLFCVAHGLTHAMASTLSRLRTGSDRLRFTRLLPCTASFANHPSFNSSIRMSLRNVAASFGAATWFEPCITLFHHFIRGTTCAVFGPERIKARAEQALLRSGCNLSQGLRFGMSAFHERRYTRSNPS